MKVRSGVQWVGAAASALAGVGALAALPPAVGVLVAAVFVALVAVWLSTPLRVEGEDVVVRPWVGARRIPRSDIVAVDVVPIQWSFSALRLRLADGSTVLLDRLTQLRPGGAADRAAEALR